MKENYSKYSKPASQSASDSPQPRGEVKMGEVNCKSLNVRSTPEVKDGNIIGILPQLTKLHIFQDEKAEGTEFYKIRSVNGVEGYAMKQYIRVIRLGYGGK